MKIDLEALKNYVYCQEIKTKPISVKSTNILSKEKVNSVI